MENGNEKALFHSRVTDESSLTRTDRLGLAYCRLNCWGWDEILGPKPEGFDEMPDTDDGYANGKRTVYPTKADYITPAMKGIEDIIGEANTSRCWWVFELGRTEEEWFRWYTRDRLLYDCEKLSGYFMTKEQTERFLQSADGRKNNFQNGKVVLDENAGGKANGAEKDTEPELNPRSGRIFTPAFVRSLFGRLCCGFLAGLFFSFLLKLIFVSAH